MEGKISSVLLTMNSASKNKKEEGSPCKTNGGKIKDLVEKYESPAKETVEKSKNTIVEPEVKKSEPNSEQKVVPAVLDTELKLVRRYVPQDNEMDVNDIHGKVQGLVETTLKKINNIQTEIKYSPDSATGDSLRMAEIRERMEALKEELASINEDTKKERKWRASLKNLVATAQCEINLQFQVLLDALTADSIPGEAALLEIHQIENVMAAPVDISDSSVKCPNIMSKIDAGHRDSFGKELYFEAVEKMEEKAKGRKRAKKSLNENDRHTSHEKQAFNDELEKLRKISLGEPIEEMGSKSKNMNKAKKLAETQDMVECPDKQTSLVHEDKKQKKAKDNAKKSPKHQYTIGGIRKDHDCANEFEMKAEDIKAPQKKGKTEGSGKNIDTVLETKNKVGETAVISVKDPSCVHGYGAGQRKAFYSKADDVVGEAQSSKSTSRGPAEKVFKDFLKQTRQRLDGERNTSEDSNEYDSKHESSFEEREICNDSGVQKEVDESSNTTLLSKNGKVRVTSTSIEKQKVSLKHPNKGDERDAKLLHGDKVNCDGTKTAVSVPITFKELE